MTKLQFMKGLLGASALTVLSAGSAFAQDNNFTQAGTEVVNTFNLTYDVGSVAQPPITNDNTNERTIFNVDRLVNVTVAAAADTVDVSPNQENAFVEFTVRNDGNDTHAYFLAVEEVTSDDFDGSASTSGDDIIYFEDLNDDGVVDGAELDAANAIQFGGSDFPVLDPDDVIVVRVVRNIPVGVSDTEESSVHLYADTREEGDLTIEINADNDTVNATLVTENVLADGDGPAAADGPAPDGAHSDTSTFTVLSADVTATKQVFSVSDAPCVDIPAGPYTPPADNAGNYFLPETCAEYVITVENDGTADATNIDLTDILPAEIAFVDAELRGGLTGGTLTEPAVTGDACTPTTCEVNLTNGTIPGRADATAGPTVGYLVIRATIQ